MFIMIDKEFVGDPKTPNELRDQGINKVVQTLEALAWLYNCSKLQLELTSLPQEFADHNDFWMVNRNKCYYYNKN